MERKSHPVGWLCNDFGHKAVVLPQTLVIPIDLADMGSAFFKPLILTGPSITKRTTFLPLRIRLVFARLS